jgi:uncharacterized protein YjgD (DUF1641 family)
MTNVLDEEKNEDLKDFYERVTDDFVEKVIDAQNNLYIEFNRAKLPLLKVKHVYLALLTTAMHVLIFNYGLAMGKDFENSVKTISKAILKHEKKNKKMTRELLKSLWKKGSMH